MRDNDIFIYLFKIIFLQPAVFEFVEVIIVKCSKGCMNDQQLFYDCF